MTRRSRSGVQQPAGHAPAQGIRGVLADEPHRLRTPEGAGGGSIGPVDRGPQDDSSVDRTLDAAAASDVPVEVVTPVLDGYRARVERMLRLRMDPRVVGRVGVSDVMQDALVEVTRRLPRYLEERGAEEQGERKVMPFFLWFRFIAGQSLQQAHRRHLGTLARDAAREVSIQAGEGMPEATSRLLASALVASGISPASAAAADEQRELLADALDDLAPADREILFLRHFEQLSNGEISTLLDLTSSAASLRHLRALGRLQRSLGKVGVRFDADSTG